MAAKTRSTPLGFWRRHGWHRRHFERNDGALKPAFPVRAVAKRLVFRMPAAAQSDLGAPVQPKRLSVLIDQLEIAFHFD